MHNIQVDRILTEAREECYHDLRSVDCLSTGAGWIECKKCEMTVNRPPSPTTNWQDYGEVIEWAKKEKLFNEFIVWHIGFLVEVEKYHNHLATIQADILTAPQKGSHALAEFIEREGV